MTKKTQKKSPQKAGKKPPTKTPTKTPSARGGSYRDDLERRGLADEHDRKARAVPSRDEPAKKPKRGARTAARAADEEKALKKAKQRKAERRAAKEAMAAPIEPAEVPEELQPAAKRGAPKQTRLSEDGAPGEFLPEASWQERQIVQRLGVSTHFSASLDTETFEAFQTAGTFLQRVQLMKDRMKALPTVKVIPEGAHEAEAHVLVREAEIKFGLGERPYDFEAAKPIPRPPPRVVEPEVVVKPKTVLEEPKTFEACGACKGSGKIPTACADPRCGEPLYVHACNLGGEAPCGGCSGSGKIACRACAGQGVLDREDKTPGGTVTLQEPCMKCRPEEHAEFRRQNPPPTPGEPEAPVTEAPTSVDVATPAQPTREESQ
jgi:hypothetical protein